MDRRLFLTLATLAAAAPAWAIAAEGEKKPAGGGSYVAINTLLGATIRAGGRHGVMSVDCGLDVPDATLRTRVEQSIPRLRAAYVQTIQTYAAGLSDGALPNADYLGQTLQRQTDAILGRPGARLLLGGIVVN
ncbi:MAG: Tat pathway signal protein [Alphaproteobacteria bacterium]|nr:Tat pathway signal protein [Alphaproteobacteria bacterium]MBU1514936.1 Tat pathway signal protein [Alphaproteobacteria bacterium]MBU2095627.1 Tat pathway signal protein [Alphaproteobacteria bacterium]MBU2153925.1 Tat pathway signal protein [Alphaproteobacteria bacterium]MBU2309088.1 Tat pathway signal protein [Alphaproteobacteria bacterium]